MSASSAWGAPLGRLRFSSFRSRILVIALLPALLTEFGMVAYFTHQAFVTAEATLHARAANAANHLATTLSSALSNGDLPQARRLLEIEIRNSRMAFGRVSDPDGRPLVHAGRPLPAAPAGDYYLQTADIHAPGASGASGTHLGRVEVGVAAEAISMFKRESLVHAVLLMLGALLLTAALAWRLSNRLAGQLRHVGEVVGRLACDDLTVRTHLPAQGEVGALAKGVNEMAEALQAHRRELERRIHEATADLAAKKDLAERANQAKSRFFAAASHDLRQPLHALWLFVAALKARTHQPETQTLIDNIESSAAAMELLFNALLDISRLDAGTIEPHRVHFPLQKLMRDLEQRFRAVAAEKHLRLRFRPCDITLYSDPLLIERILINLISNAIRYTDDGGVLIACRRRGRMMRISVIDTGRGIPADQQESVFHEFVQLHNAARDRSRGLGLGLAIVARLGRLLEHRVDLRSRPGHGSSFSIDVPLGETHLIPAPAPVSPPGTIPADTLVLLVDDESAILRGMAELFENWNIDLVTAHSASEAEQWLDSLERTPDVIVSAYRLPEDTDGIEVIRRLREKYGSGIPAILVTGDTAPDTIQRIAQAGFPLLHKPLRPAKLRALLTHLVQQARGPAVG